MTEQTTLLPPRAEKVWEFRIEGEPMQYRTPDTRVLQDKFGKLIPKRDKVTGQIVKPFIVVQHPDKRVTKWEEEIKKQIRVALHAEFDPILHGGPVWMEMWIFITRPKSVTSMYPDKVSQRVGDRTNYLKSCEDGVEIGLQHDVAHDTNGKVTKREGFNDGQVVSGPIEKRWAWYNYPDCGRQAPGILVKLKQMDTSLEKELNRDYRAYLKREGMEYTTEVYGRKKDKKRIVLRKIGQGQIERME